MDPLRTLSAFFLAAALALSCSRPESFEAFVPSSDVVGNLYEFDLDLSDSTCRYDILFYTKIDRSPFNHTDSLTSFPMKVVWVSPSTDSFSETVYYPSWEQVVPYRSAVMVREPGKWRLSVILSQPPAGLRGLGVICKNHNGTRQTP